tara:strand:+ start:802 stop:1350 length:549 start_codon:yes stop_codon:yes gene_type:complete
MDTKTHAQCCTVQRQGRGVLWVTIIYSHTFYVLKAGPHFVQLVGKKRAQQKVDRGLCHQDRVNKNHYFKNTIKYALGVIYKGAIMSNEQRLEKRIIGLVNKIAEARNRLLRLHIQMVDCQTRLSRLIDEYRKSCGDHGVDMLFDAIIDDGVLEQRDIMIAFEYNEKMYRDALKRYFDRKNQK